MGIWDKFRAMSGIKQGIIVVVVLLLVFGVLGCVTSSTSSPAATPAPTTVPTEQPTVVPVQPTAAPAKEATPAAQTPSSAITPLTSSQLATVESSMESNGYTVTQHMVRNGSTPDGYPMYTGMFAKDGISYYAIIIQTDSPASAQAYLPTAVANVETVGFTGSYNTDGTWSGTMTSNGSPLGASVLVSGNVVIQTLAGYE